MWLQLNGWAPDDLWVMYLCLSLISMACLAAIFAGLHRMSVWGPWAMRDFTCLLPPGSLLCTFAFWDLGYLNHRSWTFVVALGLSSILDVARAAAIWMAILITLANKWYALQGGFLSLSFVCLCRAISPLVVDILGRLMCGYSPVFDVVTPDHPEVDISALEQATLCSVWPLSLAAYALQLVAIRYFNFEVLTYKGHGNQMPDGTSFGPGSESYRIGMTAPARQDVSWRLSGSGTYVNHSDTETDSDSADGPR